MSALLLALLLDETLAAGPRWEFPASLAIATVAVGLGVGGRALAAALALLLPFVTLASPSPAFSFATAWLLLHVFLPTAPFGSLAARGREDPGAGWTMPGWYPSSWRFLFVLSRFGEAAQAAMDGPSWLAAAWAFCALLALPGAGSFAAWGISFALGLFLTIDGGAGLAEILVLHLLAFQPAWLPRREDGPPSTVFYDGTCALCHGCVRFLLAEDRDPPRFHVAPLDGPAFCQLVPERIRMTRPDSILVVRGEDVFVKSSAIIVILETLGGLWRVLALLLQAFPRALVDVGYNVVARHRYRWFGRKAEACPLLPPNLRSRFEA